MIKIASLVVASLFLVATRIDAEVLAVIGGTIIDGNGGKPLEDGVILIDDKRITAVGGKTTLIPPQAKRIAAGGKYIIPGLMDANVHLVLDTLPLTLIRYEGRYDELAVEAAQVALKNGLTTVFDSWGPREYLIKARNAIREGRVAGSRIYLAGNIVGLGGPYTEDFWGQLKEPGYEAFVDRINAIWQENIGPELVSMSPEEVRREIRKYVLKDIDFLKYAVNRHLSEFIAFSPRVQQVIVEEAHRAGITVQTHTMSGEGLDLAIRAGVDLMQHCEATYREPLPAETVALVAQRRIPCAFIAHTPKALAWYRQKDRKLYDLMDLNQRALLRAGAVVLLSTDAGVFSADTLNSPKTKDSAPPEDNRLILGEGHFLWLLAVEQMGMKPMDALMAATRNIARAYKVDKDLGTLEKGKIADLLVLDKNPLDSAVNYRSIRMVLKEGKVIDLSSLPTQKLLTAVRSQARSFDDRLTFVGKVSALFPHPRIEGVRQAIQDSDLLYIRVIGI